MIDRTFPLLSLHALFQCAKRLDLSLDPPAFILFSSSPPLLKVGDHFSTRSPARIDF